MTIIKELLNNDNKCLSLRKDTETCKTGAVISIEGKQRKIVKDNICPFDNDDEAKKHCKSYK